MRGMKNAREVEMEEGTDGHDNDSSNKEHGYVDPPSTLQHAALCFDSHACLRHMHTRVMHCQEK